MPDSPNDTDSIGEQQDDSQLTIRIPNPKVYMARQSLWIGRRGKPRCDHCRINNLKCDRVLPACNHCAWAPDRECKYTPLPTPAHRGIPRCDRCRARNLKCDRNLPICNHCSEEKATTCNYTPKKRPKVARETSPASDQQQKGETTAYMPDPMDAKPLNDTANGHTFYGHNIASVSAPPGTRKSHTFSSPVSGESPGDGDDSHYASRSGRYRAESSKERSAYRASLPLLAPKPSHSPRPIGTFLPATFDPDQGVVLSASHIEPWSQASFAPLPDYIVQRLRLTTSVEVPSRTAFNDALSSFIDGLMTDLREVSCLTPDTYACLARYLNTHGKGDFPDVSERVKSWATHHHLRSGSNKQHLIIMPKDQAFSAKASDEAKLIAAYCARIDEPSQAQPNGVVHPEQKTPNERETMDPLAAFERLPVRPQIYDILTYAHRHHSASFAMSAEVRKMGLASITWPMIEMYVRLCPLCNLRAKQDSTQFDRAT